jgi:tRNA ligase
MDIEDILEQAVDRAVAACVSILGLLQTSAEDIDQSVRKARDYVPSDKEVSRRKEQEPTPCCFGLLSEVDLIDGIGKQMADASDAPENGRAFWNASCHSAPISL